MPEKSRWREALLYGVGTYPMVEEMTAFRVDEQKEKITDARKASHPGKAPSPSQPEPHLVYN